MSEKVSGRRKGADTPPIIAKVSGSKACTLEVLRLCPDSGATRSMISKDITTDFKDNNMVLLDVQGQDAGGFNTVDPSTRMTQSHGQGVGYTGGDKPIF